MIRTAITGWILLFTLAGHGCARSAGADGIDVQQQARISHAGDTSNSENGPGHPSCNVDLPRYPSISPNGREIVFSWRGDLWKVASAGGQAIRLTSHPRDDLQSAWSSDGTRIAFNSDRTGHLNLYVMDANGTGIRQVAQLDRACYLHAFGTDEGGNEVLTFWSYLEGDVYSAGRPYMIAVDGTGLTRIHDAFGAYPAVGPDGEKVAFTRGGARWTRRHYRGPAAFDAWLYDRGAKSFTQLTQWQGNDGRARWADENTLLYLSDRESNCVNVYRMDVTKGEKSARRLTGFVDDDVKYFDVSADGSTAVLVVWGQLYTLDLNEPDAQPVPLVVYANEDEGDRYQLKAIDREVSEAVLSPDGKMMAFVAYGEVYVRNIEEQSPTRRVTNSPAREKHITWSPDGLKLYFVSDRSGTDSIYSAAVALTRKEIREDFEKAVNPPEEKEEDEKAESETAADGDESEPSSEDDATSAGGEEPPPADKTEKGDTPEDPGDEENEEEDGEPESKEGEKKEKEEEELPKELQPDRWHDAVTFTIKPVVETTSNDQMPGLSLDGKSLAFRRRGDLMIMNLEDGEMRRLIAGWDTNLHWRWSPDSRYIAYAQSDLNYNSDIWIVPADGSQAPVNITRHPDNDFYPCWSADGRVLSFLSERVNEENDVWMVYLDENLESLTPKDLADYYKKAVEQAKKRKPLKIEKPEKKNEGDDHGEDDEADGDKEDDVASESDVAPAKESDAENDKPEEDRNKPAKDADKEEEEEEEEPVEYELENAYLRLHRVTTLSGSESNNEITPGGDRYVFSATVGEFGLFTVKWDGKDRKRLAGDGSVQHVSLTGDKIIIVSSGRAGTIGPEGNKIEYVDISDKIRIDLEEQSSQKFLEAARELGEEFYHPTMKGLDWPALTAKYHTLARKARTAGEFNHVANRFIGELNASHLGVYSRSPDSPIAQDQGRLGTFHHRVSDGFEVTKVIPESPAAKGKMALQVGDIITAVDLKPFGPTDTVESRLVGRVGLETIITIRRVLDTEEPKELNTLVTPINFGNERQLKYKMWRRERAEQVAEWSDGRLGYIHIQSMGQASLDVFERDLYAAAGGKEGLIIDVRDNGGGWTTDRLLASIMAPYHAYTMPRGADRSRTDGYPQDRLFIQHYTLPINMLCNENSFSNAEIISHAFKTLKRGTLVGQQTYGAVISTGATRLIDGTLVRLPLRGWYLPNGTDMDNHGAMPDIVVPQTPEAESRNDDEQLRAAVDDLLKRL